jgi:hypothetical protein
MEEVKGVTVSTEEKKVIAYGMTQFPKMTLFFSLVILLLVHTNLEWRRVDSLSSTRNACRKAA